MPVQKYEIELSDGRKFVVETEGGPPSEQDVLASLSSQTEPAAPAEAPPEPEKAHPMSSYGQGAARGVGQGLLSMIDIPAMAKSVYAVSQVPERLIRSGVGAVTGDLTEGRALVDDATALAKGIGYLGSAAIGMEGPEAMGEAHGNLLTGTIPVGGLLSKAAQVGKMSRVGNVVKATGAKTMADVANVEELVKAGRLDSHLTNQA